MKSRVVAVRKNTIYGLILKVVNLALSFFSRIVFIKFLGAEFLGINSLFSSVLSILCLADLGFGTALVYGLYKPLAENDLEKTGAYVRFFKVVYLSISITILIIGLALIPFLPYLVNLDTSVDHIYFYYVLFLLNTVCSYLFVYKTAVLQADQKAYVVNNITSVAYIFKFLAQTLILVFTKNYFLYLSVLIASTFSINLFASLYVKRHYQLDTKAILSKGEKKNVFNNVRALFVYKMFTTLVNSADNIIISTMAGTLIVGYYSNYTMIVTLLISFATIITSSTIPSIGNLLNSNDRNRAAEVFKVFQYISFILFGVICIGIYAEVQDAVYIISGFNEDYILDNWVVVALTINVFFSYINYPVAAFREASGLFVDTRWMAIVFCVSNVVLSVVLGYYFGAAGVIVATSISRLMTTFWFEPILLFKKVINISLIRFFANVALYCVIVCVGCAVGRLIVGSFSIGNVYLSFVIKTIVIAIFALGWLVCFTWFTENFKLSLLFIRRKILRR